MLAEDGVVTGLGLIALVVLVDEFWVTVTVLGTCEVLGDIVPDGVEVTVDEDATLGAEASLACDPQAVSRHTILPKDRAAMARRVLCVRCR